LVIIGLALWFLERWIAHSPTWQRILSHLSSLIKRKPWLPAFVGFGFSALATTLFVEIAEATLWQREMDLLDNVVIWLVRYFASPKVDEQMIFITNLGYGWVLLVLLAPICGWQVYRRQWTALISLLLCLTGSAALNFLLKHLFMRARPELFRVVDAAGYSFPSGHAMVSLCFYGMLAYLLSRHLRQYIWRLIIYGMATILVTAIGLSRIYLGVHYPTDVLAGYTAGMTWLVICISLHIWWPHRS
jgi:undecaprenyl-diphosphatase